MQVLQVKLSRIIHLRKEIDNMAEKKSRLGKGMNEIFGSDISALLEGIQNGSVDHGQSTTELNVSEIKPNPYQPRKQFDEKSLKELSESIATHGVFTPILVKKSVQGYELIAGERRLRASKMANLEKIPAIIMEFDDQQMMEIALLENIQREDLNAIEEAMGYHKMIEKLGITQDQLAKRIGKSREHVTNMLRLLKLPKSIQQYVLDGKLSMGHVRALLACDDEERMETIAKQAIKDKLSVRKVEELVKAKPKQVKEEETDPIFEGLQTRLQNKFQTRVKLDKKQITISYYGTDDLNRILEILDCLDE